MKFGYLKTAIEQKLITSFVNENLTNDMKKFKELVLSSKPTKTLFFIYDKLNENLGLDKDSAIILVDEIIKETQDIEIPKKHLVKLVEWLGDNFENSNYEIIDNMLNKDIKNIQERTQSKKIIIEGLMKQKYEKKQESSKVPISSLQKVANSVAKKYLSQLDENSKNEVLNILKENSQVLETKFNDEKTEVLSKLSNLIESESEEETKTKIVETKERISLTKFSVNEYMKLKELNSQLTL
jgi:hypothetical protein